MLVCIVLNVVFSDAFLCLLFRHNDIVGKFSMLFYNVSSLLLKVKWVFIELFNLAVHLRKTLWIESFFTYDFCNFFLFWLGARGGSCSVKTEATAFKTNYTVFYENQHFAEHRVEVFNISKETEMQLQNRLYQFCYERELQSPMALFFNEIG